MFNRKALLLISTVLTLSSCSSVTNMFGSDKEETKLEGDRISVLELQRSLKPDSTADQINITLPQAWQNESWPQAGGYPNHSMQNLLLSSTSFKRTWSTDIGSGSSDEIPLNAQPVIANGHVFTLDTDANLSAFNAQNGKRIWKTSLEPDDEDENVISGGVSFAHGLLYVTNGYDEVLAVSPENGEILWRKRLPSPSRAAPTVIGGRIFVNTIDSRVVALSAKDGSQLWEYVGIGEMAGLLGTASPAANNDIVVATFSSGEITALRVENGSVVWSDNLASVRQYGGGLESLSDIRAMPVIDRGLIFAISFSGKLAAIDERTGTRVWQREISGAQTPWISGDTLFVLSSESQVIALNAVSGAVLWITELQRFEDEKDKEDLIRWNGPLMASDKLILTSSHGYIVEISPKNGDITRTVNIKQDTQIAPVIANGLLYVLEDDATLSAYQ